MHFGPPRQGAAVRSYEATAVARGSGSNSTVAITKGRAGYDKIFKAHTERVAPAAAQLRALSALLATPQVGC